MSEWQQQRAVLVALLELAADATGGPWQYVPDDEGPSMGWINAPVTYQGKLYQNLVAKILGDSAEAAHTADFIAAARNATDAIDKALALADRAAEAERLLAEYVDSVDGGWGSDERLDLIRRVRAHRNAAQQEGQGDGD